MMTEGNVLIHHGIKGQKWGIRRFQNEDGSRTSAGLARDRQTYAERSDGESDDTPARKGLSEGQKNALKTVGKVALAAAAVGATAYLYSQHKDEIDGLIRQTKAQLFNKLPTEIEASGRTFVQGAFDSASKSIALKAERREAIQNVAKKAIGAVEGAKDSAADAAKNAVGKAKDAVSDVAVKAKNAASNTADKAKDAAANAGKSIQKTANKAAKSAGEGLKSAAKSADDKLTAYMVTRTMEKAAERRLQNKQEKNRHKEEMARIRRGG